jgi:hypothetical protein
MSDLNEVPAFRALSRFRAAVPFLLVSAALAWLLPVRARAASTVEPLVYSGPGVCALGSSTLADNLNGKTGISLFDSCDPATQSERYLNPGEEVFLYTSLYYWDWDLWGLVLCNEPGWYESTYSYATSWTIAYSFRHGGSCGTGKYYLLWNGAFLWDGTDFRGGWFATDYVLY